MTTLEPTGDTRTGNAGLKLIRITTWVWLSIVLTAATRLEREVDRTLQPAGTSIWIRARQ